MHTHHQKVLKRLLSGVSANVFGQIVNAFIQVAMIPIFLKAWGASVFGEWLLLTSLATYFSMTDIGLSTAAANEMTILVAAGDKKSALTIFQSCFVMVFIISTIIFLIVASLVIFLPIRQYLNIHSISSLHVKLIIVLMTLEVIIQLQRNIISAGFRSDGHYAFAIFMNNLVRLMVYTILLTGVFLGFSPLQCAVFLVTSQALGLWILKWKLKSRVKWLKYGFKDAKVSCIKRILEPSLGSMGLKINRIIGNQGLVTVIGIVLGGYAVSLFSTIRTLCRLSFQAINVVCNAVMPEISMAWGTKDITLAKKLHRSSFRICFWISIFVIGFLVLFGHRIYVIWTRHKLVFNSVLFRLMLIVTFVNGMWYVSSVVQLALNKHIRLAKWNLFLTCITVITSALTLRIFGINSVAVLLLLTDLCMTIVVFPYTFSLLEEKCGSFMLEVLSPPLYVVSSLKRYFFEVIRI